MRGRQARYIPALQSKSAAGRANNSIYDGVHQHGHSLAMLLHE
jgi:hypothetical protein